ncbi:dethiobiotin synthase [Haladaptatus sp. YSMS36]|uniref:dethiobiotin synthase n=1 Tax=Haladaptatus sp. YSMS36 TaxID=3033384 RepID=UPI0023E85F50|nr:dethiobiotin synthase [Haladaptatus sp. YSMS36]
MTEDFAVVGTDTGVGKTVVTAGLVGNLREVGVAARAVKPCQTGFPPDDDAGFVADVCGTAAAATCLRRLEEPLAPAVAAEKAGNTLSYETLLADCEQALADAACGVLEGIGGLRVPLAEGREVLDLVADLDLPAVVVARSGLGTLNHTALTVDALCERGLPVRGVVLNEYEGATVAERTNPAMLERMIDVPVETLPPLDLTDPTAIISGTAEHLSDSLLTLNQ